LLQSQMTLWGEQKTAQEKKRWLKKLEIKISDDGEIDTEGILKVLRDKGGGESKQKRPGSGLGTVKGNQE